MLDAIREEAGTTSSAHGGKCVAALFPTLEGANQAARNALFRMSDRDVFICLHISCYG
ncbi:hypothetical protein EO087_14790 [Dyella sp. M7H15-1]|nr:hypothetical protein EO087_14790 [Dyella sp. M7H15-1]